MLCGLPIPKFSLRFSLNKKPEGTDKKVKDRPTISPPIPKSPLKNMDPTWLPVGKAGNGADPSGRARASLRTKTSPTEPDLAIAYTTQAKASGLIAELEEKGTITKAADRGLSPTRPKQRPGMGSIDTFFGGPQGSREYSSSGVPAARRPLQSTYLNPGGQLNVSSSNHVGPTPGYTLSKGKGKAEDIDPPAEDLQAYTQELKHMFGPQGVDIGISNLQGDQYTTTSGNGHAAPVGMGERRESYIVGRVKAPTSPSVKPKAKRPTPPQTQEPAFIISKRVVHPKGAGRGHAPSRSRESPSQVPKERMEFEEISRRVVKSTPDKTVTISTWREQVAQEATIDSSRGGNLSSSDKGGNQSEVERISVYYVSGNAGQEALAHATAELEGLGDRLQIEPSPLPTPLPQSPAPRVLSSPPVQSATFNAPPAGTSGGPSRSKEREYYELPQLTTTSQPLAEIMALSPEQETSLVYSSPDPGSDAKRYADRHVQQGLLSPQSRRTAATPSWIRPSQYLPSTVVNAIRDHQRPSSSRFYSHSPTSPPRSPGGAVDHQNCYEQQEQQFTDLDTSFDDDDESLEPSRFASQCPPTPPPKLPPTLPRLKTGSKLMQSTPVVSAFGGVGMPSFHPTRDGSVISSIKSREGDQSRSLGLSLYAPRGNHVREEIERGLELELEREHAYPSPKPSMSPQGSTLFEESRMHPVDATPAVSNTNASAIATLDTVLTSLRPSLLHLKPTLALLGITTPDHLKALAELDVEIRDRELKPEALKAGVTNMEWAMLMGKLKNL